MAQPRSNTPSPLAILFPSRPPPFFIEAHPTPSFHQRSLDRRVRGLQTVPEGGVLRVGEPVGSVSLQCRKLPYQRREVAGRVPGYILRFTPA